MTLELGNLSQPETIFKTRWPAGTIVDNTAKLRLPAMAKALPPGQLFIDLCVPANQTVSFNGTTFTGILDLEISARTLNAEGNCGFTNEYGYLLPKTPVGYFIVNGRKYTTGNQIDGRWLLRDEDLLR